MSKKTGATWSDRNNITKAALDGGTIAGVSNQLNIEEACVEAWWPQELKAEEKPKRKPRAKKKEEITPPDEPDPQPDIE